MMYNSKTIIITMMQPREYARFCAILRDFALRVRQCAEALYSERVSAGRCTQTQHTLYDYKVFVHVTVKWQKNRTK